MRFVHAGNWGAYVSIWQERLKKVQDLDAIGKPIQLQKKDTGLAGKDIGSYISLMEKRVKFLQCAQRIMQTLN